MQQSENQNSKMLDLLNSYSLTGKSIINDFKKMTLDKNLNNSQNSQENHEAITQLQNDTSRKQLCEITNKNIVNCVNDLNKSTSFIKNQNFVSPQDYSTKDQENLYQIISYNEQKQFDYQLEKDQLLVFKDTQIEELKKCLMELENEQISKKALEISECESLKEKIEEQEKLINKQNELIERYQREAVKQMNKDSKDQFLFAQIAELKDQNHKINLDNQNNLHKLSQLSIQFQIIQNSHDNLQQLTKQQQSVIDQQLHQIQFLQQNPVHNSHDLKQDQSYIEQINYQNQQLNYQLEREREINNELQLFNSQYETEIQKFHIVQQENLNTISDLKKKIDNLNQQLLQPQRNVRDEIQMVKQQCLQDLQELTYTLDCKFNQELNKKNDEILQLNQTIIQLNNQIQLLEIKINTQNNKDIYSRIQNHHQINHEIKEQDNIRKREPNMKPQERCNHSLDRLNFDHFMKRRGGQGKPYLPQDNIQPRINKLQNENNRNEFGLDLYQL